MRVFVCRDDLRVVYEQSVTPSRGPSRVELSWETASVAQFPAKIGGLGIATLYKAVTGQKVPKNVDTGTALVIPANAAKFG